MYVGVWKGGGVNMYVCMYLKIYLIDCIFQGSFRLTAKLSGRYRELYSHPLPPHMHSLRHYQHALCQSGTFFALDELTHYHPKSQFILGVIHFISCICLFLAQRPYFEKNWVGVCLKLKWKNSSDLNREKIFMNTLKLLYNCRISGCHMYVCIFQR